MSTPQRLACPLCGFVNSGALARSRCLSCGGAIDQLAAASRTRPTQPSFNPSWFAIAFGISLLLTAAVVFGVPRAVPVFDFEGSAGMLVAIPTWFLAGLLVGLIAPSGTLAELVVATALVAAPTAFVLFEGQTVKTMPAALYAALALIGPLFALIGAHFGERLQRGPALKVAPRSIAPRK